MSFFSRMFIGTDREFGGIEMDAILTEQYDMSSTVTDHPVDIGSDISDHIIRQPVGYLIQGVVTDTPMGLLAALEQIGNTVNTAVNFLRENLLGEEPQNEATSRSLAAFQALVALWEDGVLFDVQTGMGLYQDMSILNIQVSVDQNTAGHLNFVARLRQIKRVAVLTTEEEANTLAEGDLQEGAEPVKKEGLKQKVTKVAASVRDSVVGFFS